MPDSILRFLLGYFFVVIPGAWLFLAFYNLIICYHDRGPLKTLLRHLNSLYLFCVLALPLALASTGIVGQVLFLSPESAFAKVLVALVACVWIIALAGQIVTSHGLLRPRHVRALRERTVAPKPFEPNASDWQRGTPDCELPRPDTSEDRPARMRELDPVEPFPSLSKLSLRQPIRSFNHAYDLEVIRLRLAFANLPEKFSGIRMLFISDLHIGRDLSPGYFRHLIETANDEKADLLLYGGDFTSRDNFYQEAAGTIAAIDAPMGRYAVLGNHDFFTEPDLLSYWMGVYGIEHLKNRSVDFYEHGEKHSGSGDGPRLRVIGTEHPHEPVRDWPKLLGDDPETFRLVISHRPDYAMRLGQAGADLVVSGHTHGGQWRFPIIGPLIVPSLYGRRYAQGLFDTGTSLLYTSRGCGLHTIPVRFRCPPEITVFELVSGER